jgi:hypothetical protein
MDRVRPFPVTDEFALERLFGHSADVRDNDRPIADRLCSESGSAAESILLSLPCEAHPDVYLKNGEQLHADVDVVRGHPDNPMSWDGLHDKFEGLVEPILGPGKATGLFEAARGFLRPGAFRRVMELLEPGVEVD